MKHGMTYYVYDGHLNSFTNLEDAIEYAVEIGGVEVTDEDYEIVYKADED